MANKESIITVKIVGTDKIVSYKREILDTEKKLRDLRKSTNNNLGAQKAAATEFTKLEAKLKKVKTQYSAAQKELNGFNNKLKDAATEKAAKKTAELNNKVKQLKTTYKQSQVVVKDLTNRNRKLRSGFVSQQREIEVLNKRLAKLKLRYDTAKNGARDLNNKLKNGTTFTQRLSAGFSNASKSAVGFAARLAVTSFGVLALFNGIGSGIKTMADFEQQMARVEAITGATGEELQALKDDAKELGQTTLFTAKEVGSLQEELAKLGFTTDEIQDSTAAILELSTATQSDLAQAADVAGSTLRAFNLEASEMQRIVDIMAASFTGSALNLERFQESMKLAAPSAAALGISVEETTAFLATLADSGIRGSIAGTNLRRIFLELTKSGVPLDKALKKVQGSSDKLGTAFDLVGAIGANALLILSENEQKSNDLTKAFNNVDGAAAGMAATVSDTLTGDTKLLTSAWDGLILSFEGGNNVIRSVVQTITRVVNSISDLVSATEEQEKGTIELFDTNTKFIKQNTALVKTYEELTSKEDLNEQEKDQLNTTTNSLIGAFGESVISINEETGALTLNTQEIKTQIQLRAALQSEQVQQLLADKLRLETQFAQTESNKLIIQQIKEQNKNSIAITSATNAALEGSEAFIESQEAQRRSGVSLTESEEALIKTINKLSSSELSSVLAKKELAVINKTLEESGIDLDKIVEAQTDSRKGLTDADNKGIVAKNKLSQADKDAITLAKIQDDLRIKDIEDRDKRIIELEKQRLKRQIATINKLEVSEEQKNKAIKVAESIHQKTLFDLGLEADDRRRAREEKEATEKLDRLALALENQKLLTKQGTEERLNAEIEELEKFLIAEIDLLGLEGDERVNAELRVQEEIQKIRDKFANEGKAKDAKDKEEKDRQDEEDLINLASTLGLAAELINEDLEKESEKLKVEQEKQIKQLQDQQKKQTNLTKEEKDLQLKNLEAQQQEETALLEKEQESRKNSFKVFASGEALAATLLAINKALTAGPFLGPILASLVAAQGFANIKKINEAKRGGKVPKANRGGVIQGASHINGGVPIMVNGRQAIEAEGNEPILTAGVSSSPADMATLSEINTRHGGVPLAANGAVVPSVQSTTNQTKITINEDSLAQKIGQEILGNITPVLAVSEVNDINDDEAQVNAESEI